MNKLALLPLLALPACAAPGENARLLQASVDHAQALCVGHGEQPGTEGYTRCMVNYGHRDGYLVALADDGNAVFALPSDTSLPSVPGGGVYPRGTAYPRGNPQTP
jgi:hypothetical protein